MKRLPLGVIVLTAMALPGVAQDSITPPTFSATLPVGNSTTVNKVVTIGKVSTPVDILFLTDTTGSMGPTLASVAAGFSHTVTTIAGFTTDAEFGVGEYKDFFQCPSDGFAYQLDADVTAAAATVQAALNALNAGGGCDAPESNLYGLQQAASTTTWRAGSLRLVIWVGDNAGHDPAGTATEATAIAALKAAGVIVIAASASSGPGLDAICDSAPCGTPNANQAARITAATGGDDIGTFDPTAINSAIESAIQNAIAKYSTVSLGVSPLPAGVTVGIVPPSISGSFDRSTTRTFNFTVTFTGTSAGTYSFPINALVNTATVAAEADTITVNKVPQTITFAPLPDVNFGTPPFTISATASSRLVVSFTSTTTSVCMVSGTSGTLVTIVKVGVCTIVASQEGDPTYLPAPSVTRSFTVNQQPTSTTLSSSPNPSTYLQSVSLLSTVAPATATGSITFYDGATALVSVPVSGGAAGFVLPTLSIGPHALGAVYSGDTNHSASASAFQTQTVNPPPTTLTISCVPGTGPAQTAASWSISCAALGGTPSYAWSISAGTLPAGLALNPSTGAISGTATVTGAYSFTITVTDHGAPAQTANQTYSGTIGSTLTLGPSSLTFNTTVGNSPQPQTLSVTDSSGLATYTTSITGGSWLSVSPASGSIPSGGTALTLNVTSAGLAQGTYTSTLTVSASDKTTAAATVTLNVAPITVTPTSLSFSYQLGDTNSPAGQSISVFSNPPGANFTATASSAGGNWLAISTNAVPKTPNTFGVTVNVAGLLAGPYSGQISIAPSAGAPVIVPVALQVGSQAPKLSVSPPNETLTLTQGSSPTGGQVTVANTGGGTLQFSALAASDQGNWLKLSGNGGSATPSSPASLGFTVDPAGLSPKIYTGSITVQDNGSSSKAVVTVTLAVSQISQSLLLSQSGMTFDSVKDGPQPPQQSFALFNQGQGSLSWSAQAHLIPNSLSAANWLTVTTPSGVLVGGQAGSGVVVSVNQTGLPLGQYYGSVDIVAPDAANSPQSISVLLNVGAVPANSGGLLSTGGLILAGTPGGTAQTQQISLFNPSHLSGNFTTTTFTANGLAWLTASPSSGILNPGPNALTIQADFSGLTTGVQNGTVRVGFDDGSTGTVNVVAVTSTASATPGGSGAGLSGQTVRPLAASCSSSKLVPNFREPVNQFAPQVAVAQLIQVEIVDDCGNAVTKAKGGTAQVTFSSEKGAILNLQDGGAGIWEGTWTPTTATAHATLQVVADESGSGFGYLLGGAALNLTVLPAGSNAAGRPNGIANAATAIQTIPSIVVPGGYVAVYGTGLAANGDCQATSAPLPDILNSTQLFLGNILLPLSYACPSQVNALIPQDLNPNVSYVLKVVRESTESVPIPVTVAELQPGIYTQNSSGSGQGSIQIGGTALLAAPAGSGSSPARPGIDILVIYGTGLGPVQGTNGEPPPADGAAAALPTIYQTTNTVTATVGGVNAPVVFSGLTPTLVALYQVNVQVPAGTPTGDAIPVVLTVTNPQDGAVAVSNTVTIAVQ